MEDDREDSVNIQDAARLMGVTEAWVYRLIREGRIGVVEGGRRGRSRHTLLSARDVERVRQERLAAHEAKGRQLRGEA